MIGTVLLAPSLAAMLGSSPTLHETEVQRLHRKGVHCMEVIERRKCAIRNFEAVLDERTNERELVTDALLRLLKLQRKAGNDEAVTELLRRFWDVGMKRRQGGHVPYSARFFPAELDMLFTVDISKVASSPVLSRSDDLADFMFTCDAQLRNDIKMTHRWRRAQRRAAAQGREPHEILYEDMDARRRRREARSREPKTAKARRRRARMRPEGAAEPIFSSTLCRVAEALGHDSLLRWTKMGGAMNHEDFERSIAVIEVPKLAAVVQAAQKAERIEPHRTNRWILPRVRYAGQAVHLAKLDRNELVIARADMIEPVVAARSRRRRRMNRHVHKLLSGVPRDSAFLAVASRSAMVGLGMSNMRRSTAKFLQALLPKPKGLQIAVVFHDYVGMFTRVPTNNPVKGRMLVRIANAVVDGRADKDPRAEAWLRNLDIAEANDRRALLMTYVMSQAQIEKMVWN